MTHLIQPSLTDLSKDGDMTNNLSRRGFLKHLGVAGAAATLVTLPSASVFASIYDPYKTPGGEIRDVSLFNVNTRETIETVFYAHGQYNQNSFNQLCHFMRDAHVNKSHWMDPKLLTLLSDIQAIFDKRLIQVTSGYRSPQTNARLARKQRGVGPNSYHMQGKAVDIRIPGVDPAHIRDVARVLQGGGVGYYPRQRFVHIDTGPVRHWTR